jgi:hypothetical protein
MAFWGRDFVGISFVFSDTMGRMGGFFYFGIFARSQWGGFGCAGGGGKALRAECT